jgi:PAS domain S-box-containing protein
MSDVSTHPRTSVALAIFVFALHNIVLWRFGYRAPGPLLSNLSEAALGVIALTAIVRAATRSGRWGRQIWLLLSSAVAIWAAAQLIITWCENVLHLSYLQPWPSDFPVFFWVFPIFMALFVDEVPKNEGTDWVLVADIGQIVVLSVAMHQWVLANPSLWEVTPGSMAALTWSATNVRDAALVIALLLRLLVSRKRLVRSLFLRLLGFVALYAVADSLYHFAEDAWGAVTGSRLDVLWSLPFLYLTFVASRWNRKDEAELEIAKARGSRMRRRTLVVFSIALPLPVLLLANALQRQQPHAALLYAVATVGIVGTRLWLTQMRQVRSDRAMRVSEEEALAWKKRYDDAVLASGQIIFDFDPVSGLTTFGGSLRQVLGYAPQDFELDPEGWRNLIHPDDLPLYLKATQKAAQGSQPYEIEYRARKIDCSFRVLREQGAITEQGGHRHLVGFITDVTEKRSLEQQLRQAQKMEAMGRLAGGVAHDFNNLLTVIEGYVEIQLQSPNSSPQVQQAAVQIKAAADRATGLTRQLLAFTRQQILQPRIVNLNQIVTGLNRMLGRLIGENVEVCTILDDSLGAVKADPAQMEQVLMNLVINARDAMANGGKLTIETANVALGDAYADLHRYASKGEYVQLAVSDNGVGMDAEARSHLFEPFYTTKEKGKGTGLGLATVYGIVKQSGGHIEVYSELGKGTTFKVYLPRVYPIAGSASPAAQEKSAVRGSETVLVVEDDESLRELVREILERQGYTVLAPNRPQDAQSLSLQQQGPVQLLLTDVVMPGISGREVAREISRHRPNIKVLFMSGYTPNSIVQHGVLEDGLAFLPKPFTPAVLLAKVREVLDGDKRRAS